MKYEVGQTPGRTQVIPAQPLVDRDIRLYGATDVPTVRVKLKASGKEVVINAADFDPALHKRTEG